MFIGIKSVFLRIVGSCCLLLVFPAVAFGLDTLSGDPLYKLKGAGRFVRHSGSDSPAVYILPNVPSYAGFNNRPKPTPSALSGHITYAFRFPAGSLGDNIYAHTYQGV